MFDLTTEDITEGSISRALVVLAAPLVIQSLTQVVQQLVDVFWLGRYGENAVAAVGLNYPIISLVVILVTLAPFVGTQVIVSQRVGGDDPEGARRIAFHGVTLGLAFAAVVGALTYVAAPEIVRLVGADPAFAEMAAIYLATYALGMPFVVVSDTLEGAFTGWGDSRAALYVTLVTVVTNLVLDPFLILGLWVFPEMGVEGAALATVAGFAAGMTLAIALAVGPRDTFSLSTADVGFDVAEYREILDVGGPLVGQRIAQDAVRVVIVGIVAVAGGAAGLVAYTVGARIASIAFIPAGGLQQASQSIIGQNLGAENPERANRTTWTGVAIAAVALGLIGAVQWFVPESLTLLFVPDISEVALGWTVQYLQILALGYWALGATYLFLGGFNGARKTKTSLVVSLAQYWGVRLPIAAVGVYLFDFGVSAVFWAVTLSNVAAAVGAGAYYYYTTSDGMFERAVSVASGGD
ncbi:MATE family efflux transporter [Haloprofundus marisrubri]|uniref:Multidrug-efflux transporter n=1 Tax=Haloprofundus marisrubri TaxID=1514971 RepID=A0A0W1RE14_9EURY|nr:MATE family efflux transporter [Haloprofundus marisrubri]KTG11634.1 MATE family efflux transporter [Haloprofundus marisrubri]